MHDYESIYQPHYEGRTYRFGVAYLISPTPTRDRNPGLSIASLDEQRRAIAAFATEHSCIVIAEIIENDTVETILDRDGFWEAIDLIRTTHPAVLIHPGDVYLNLGPSERRHLIGEAARHGADVMSAFGF